MRAWRLVQYGQITGDSLGEDTEKGARCTMFWVGEGFKAM